eukprot:scaffold10605_cov82-Isochrysis_galbana.AAC.2
MHLTHPNPSSEEPRAVGHVSRGWVGGDPQLGTPLWLPRQGADGRRHKVRPALCATSGELGTGGRAGERA